jgi:hypothetical protein
MTDDTHDGPKAVTPWTSHAATILGSSESVLLVLIGIALVLVAVLLLYSAMHDLNEAVHMGPDEIERKAIGILNTVLLVMMTMEHSGDFAQVAHAQRGALPDHRHDCRQVELGLIAATVVALAGAIWILRYSAHRFVAGENERADGHPRPR